MSRPRLIALLLALVTLVIFLPVYRGDFLTYDDNDYVTDNAMVQRGLTWAGVQWAFTTFHAANWHPLTWLSHMTDCELFGLNAAAHHLVNALIHSANVALLFYLLWRLTSLRAAASARQAGKVFPSVVVAALFAWHPAHVESVAWVAERKDVLCVFFGLLSLLCSAKYVMSDKCSATGAARTTCHASRFYWSALGFFALSLMAKPMLVTLPCVLLLLDWWPLKRFQISDFPPTLRFGAASRFSILLEKIPFFILTIASCVVTFFAQQSGKAVATLEAVSLTARMEHGVQSFALYLLKLFWPVDLAVLYPLELKPFAVTVAGGATLVLITSLVWHGRNRQPCWLVGWLWFLGTLIPVIGLVQVGNAFMADRYTYLPSVGIFIALAFGVPESFWTKKPFQAAVIAALLACVFLTENQLKYWRNSETLFRHTLAVTRNNPIAHINLGRALEQQGRIREALDEYRCVTKIEPGNIRIHFFIGNMLRQLGQPADALAEYRLCLTHTPEVPALHNAAANALAAQGKLAEALPEFAEAARLDPFYPQPHLDLAKIYFAEGDDVRARPSLEAAVKAGAQDWETMATVARFLAANTNAAARDGQSALALALKANELSGEKEPLAFDALGMAFASTGDFNNAIICAQNAIEFSNASRPEDLSARRQRLELYQKHQPWLESFRRPDPPAGR